MYHELYKITNFEIVADVIGFASLLFQPALNILLASRRKVEQSNRRRDVLDSNFHSC